MSNNRSIEVLSVKSYLNVFEKYSQSDLTSIIDDCSVVFNCRSIKKKSDNYSEGATYIVKPNETPSCNLESLALAIFNEHTKDISCINKAESGAEWWTQVIDSRDDIGFHWDRDYGTEEDTGVHIYPKFATVTYLSHVGGPTLLMDKTGGSDETIDITGDITSFIASKPLYGKHIAFDGSLLHAAPSDLLVQNEDDSDSDSGDDNNEDEEDAEDDEDSTAEPADKDDESAKSGDEEGSEGDKSESAVMRVTLLVNVWVNHIPVQSVRFPQNKVSKMGKQLLSSNSSNKSSVSLPSLNFGQQVTGPEKTINVNGDNCTRDMHWEFNNSDTNFVITVPLPIESEVERLMNEYHCVQFTYDKPDTDCVATITLADNENEESGNEEDNDGDADDNKEYGDSDDDGSESGNDNVDVEEKSRPKKRVRKEK